MVTVQRADHLIGDTVSEPHVGDHDQSRAPGVRAAGAGMMPRRATPPRSDWYWWPPVAVNASVPVFPSARAGSRAVHDRAPSGEP